ncbi:MAG: AEC family transporter [Bacteroidetes bacterium]|nr:AEC family transporter [Bacteroidota bacterium]
MISCFVGLFLSFKKISIPISINRGLESLGKMALPLSLLSVGAGLSFRQIRNSLLLALTASFINAAVLPFAGYLIGRIWALSNHQILIALIFLACPTASSVYIYARELHGNHVFAGNVIVITIIMSVFSLGAVLAIFM